MQPEYREDMIVKISDCDAGGHWRPSAVLIEMQELAEKHAATFGLSRAHLISNGVCWVLYRQHIVMRENVTFGEKLQVTTWPGAIEGPIFPRHFLFQRKDGTTVGEAATSWILMDIHTRRPMRPSALPGDVPANTDRAAPLPLPAMLRIADATPWGDRMVHYSDLDVNGHMNNTRYIDWICDALDFDTLMARGLAQWQINYISEAKQGEVLSLAFAQDGDRTLVQGKRAEDGRTVFEAFIVFR